MATFTDRYNQLNDRQKQAVDTIFGPVLVIAGPGSGKTELLSLRVANILQKTDALPSSILCLTFTEAAAGNMRQRLAGLIGDAAYKVAIDTFHSFGVNVINRYPEHFYEGATFLPIDELGQIEILEDILTELPYDSPLRSEHPEEGFVYLKDIRQAIGNLKKGGLEPETFKAILAQNAEFLAGIGERLHELFDGRLSAASLPAVEDFLADLSTGTDDPVNRYFPTLRQALVVSLGRAYQESETLGKTTPLSEWKSSHLTKDEEGKRILRETNSQRHMAALADIYARYQQALKDKRRIDFDDMLLTSIAGIRNSEALHSELQERYQYILVDEFQDTNEAQMALLDLLTDSPLNEGRPNIMAVGDDDQAIYKFQGAELANILSFKDRYRDPLIITLVHNYRSTQSILDLARQVIVQGSERLETLLPEVEKVLEAAKRDLKGNISSQTFSSKEQEYLWVAKEIRRLVEQGIMPPEEIAVIARQHRDLEELVPYLRHEQLPINYQRQQDILKSPHVRQILAIMRFLRSLCRKDQAAADDLLPEILSYPFWEIDRLAIWQLSVQANKEDKLWLDLMLEHSDPKLQQIARFFIDLAPQACSESIEFVLQAIIGAEELPLADSDNEEEGAPVEIRGYRSPFKAYYFSQHRFEHEQESYLALLSNLKALIEALRSYRPDEPITLDDALGFVALHRRYNIPVTDGSPYANGAQAVSLHTGHGAKGLEFGAVFVLNCLEESWTGSGRSSLLRFPENLPLAASADSLDDQLRLFYVAVTRAKECLYFAAYERNHKGKEMSPLPFLQGMDAKPHADSQVPELSQALQVSWQPERGPEKDLLWPLVENYKMSVTHLSNFLDVERGGPKAFLEHNLLRFPQPKSAAGAYGSAVHAALRLLACEFKSTGVLPGEEFLLDAFARQMAMERMPKGFLDNYLAKGRDALSAFYKENRDQFRADDEVERDFSGQAVTIGEAVLSGKIDRITHLDERRLQVVDYKTGRAAASWSGKDAHEKSKLYKYRRQLLFYKLLIEHSRDYHGFEVAAGRLDFVEPTPGGRMLSLGMEYEAAELERLSRLTQAVFARIKALDFPDTSGYSPDLKGMVEFEEELLTRPEKTLPAGQPHHHDDQHRRGADGQKSDRGNGAVGKPAMRVDEHPDGSRSKTEAEHPRRKPGNQGYIPLIALI